MRATIMTLCTYERSEGLQSHIYLPLEYEKKKKRIWNLRKRYAVFYKIKKKITRRNSYDFTDVICDKT